MERFKSIILYHLRTSIVFILCFFFTSYSYSQIQEEILTDSTSVRCLKGTLTISQGKGKKLPLVIFISGSGPTDRDGNSPNFRSDYLKILSQNLADNGIASFRYDKRWSGKSTVTDFNESHLVFEDFSRDAEAWIYRLKADPRFSKIVVLGHSEGSLLGMLAVQAAKADGFISVAGAGRPIDVILKEQLSANPNNPKELITDANVILDSLKAGHLVKKINSFLVSLFRPSVQPYLISWMKYDPGNEIKKINVPCLIAQGTTDIQVSIKDAEQLKLARPDANYVLIEGMNHILRDAPAERSANIAVYSQYEKPLSSSLIQALTSFIYTVK